MRPILFQWRRITVWSYPALLYIGMIAGVIAGNAAAHVAGLDPFRVFIATHVLVLPALIGARLLYVASNWTHYRRYPRRIWNRNDGGAALYGGLVLALPASVPLLAALDVPFGAFWDAATFTILVGMIVARAGCLLNGCCAGRPSKGWCSACLPNHRGIWERRIPTQYLEAGFATVLLLTGIAAWQSLPFPGALFLVVAAGYACGRLALESLREHAPDAGKFNLHHGISVAVIAMSLVALMAA